VFTDLFLVLRYHADEEMLAVFTISGPGNHTVIVCHSPIIQAY